MNAVYIVLKKSEIQMRQSFKLTYRFILSHITGQAVPDNGLRQFVGGMDDLLSYVFFVYR